MAVVYYREVVMINCSRLKVGSCAKACAGIVVSYVVSTDVGMIVTERSVLCGWLFTC